jgi:AcrR family transcriptional regulator
MAANKRRRPSVRPSYHHGDLRAALLASAARLLEKEGAEAVSFRAIARDVGVSQTAPYNHFHSKEHLLAKVAEEGFHAFTASQRAAARMRSPRRRLQALGRAYLAFAAAHPQLYRLMFGVGLGDWKRHPALVEAALAAGVPVQQALAPPMAPGRAAGQPPQAAWIATWALVHGLASLLIDGKLDKPGVGRLGDRVIGWYADLLFAESKPSRRVRRPSG